MALSQPYVPKELPVLLVTEGPFFSEVATHYEHVHLVFRLYNLPGGCGLAWLRPEMPEGGPSSNPT